MKIKRKSVPVLFVMAFLWPLCASAVEVTELEATAHGFPVLLDSNGKKLANGEFVQFIDDGHLHIAITYSFERGDRTEEKAVFRQKPELIQEEWSWRELKGGQLVRHFAVDFKTQTATAQKREKDGLKNWSEKIDVQAGRAFAGYGFMLALQNLQPRLLRGEQIELQAVGFTPTPKVVTVQISHAGVDRMKMSDRLLEGDRFVVHPKIGAIAGLLVHVPDTLIWLTKTPAEFLRWEGPVAEPNDPIIRVDLVPGPESGPAKPAEASDGH